MIGQAFEVHVAVVVGIQIFPGQIEATKYFDPGTVVQEIEIPGFVQYFFAVDAVVAGQDAAQVFFQLLFILTAIINVFSELAYRVLDLHFKWINGFGQFGQNNTCFAGVADEQVIIESVGEVKIVQELFIEFDRKNTFRYQRTKIAREGNFFIQNNKRIVLNVQLTTANRAKVASAKYKPESKSFGNLGG